VHHSRKEEKTEPILGVCAIIVSFVIDLEDTVFDATPTIVGGVLVVGGNRYFAFADQVIERSYGIFVCALREWSGPGSGEG
jgi:hypothetical protein